MKPDLLQQNIADQSTVTSRGDTHADYVVAAFSRYAGHSA